MAVALCAFFTRLSGEAGFWQLVHGLNVDRTQADQFFTTLEEFENQQTDVLTRLCVDDFTANKLARELTSSLQLYRALPPVAQGQANPVPAAQALENYVSDFGREICEAARDPKKLTWKILAKGFDAAGVLLGVVAAVGTAGTAAAVLTVVAAVCAMGSMAFDIVNERQADDDRR